MFQFHKKMFHNSWPAYVPFTFMLLLSGVFITHLARYFLKLSCRVGFKVSLPAPSQDIYRNATPIYYGFFFFFFQKNGLIYFENLIELNLDRVGLGFY